MCEYDHRSTNSRCLFSTKEAGNSTKPKAYLKRKRTQLAVKLISVLSTLLLCLAFTYCWLKRKSKSKCKTLMMRYLYMYNNDEIFV